jgi:hypothetical protein
MNFYPRLNAMDLVNTSLDTTMELVPGWHGSVWSTHVKIYFVLSLAYEVFAQRMLRFILWPRYRLG